MHSLSGAEENGSELIGNEISLFNPDSVKVKAIEMVYPLIC